MCGFIGVDGLFENTFICPHFVPETGGFSPPIVVGIISALITFGIGSFLGGIYGKMKRRKQAGAKMN
jgi:hypothetical protein